MRRGNFTDVARRTLAAVLSLTMVFGTNVMTMADGTEPGTVNWSDRMDEWF